MNMFGVTNDWQTGCSILKQRGEYLYQTGRWSDCTFLVGTEPNQVKIDGHKLILAMASPVFEAMFYGGMADKTDDPILISDVPPEAFKALLEYIYTDNIKIKSYDQACELFYTANKYMLLHLVRECSRYLLLNLNPRNVCKAYEFANLFEETVLMNKCIQLISTDTKQVLRENSFKEADINTVIMIFSMDNLNIDSELELFEAAEKYAKAQMDVKKDEDRPVSPILDSDSGCSKRAKMSDPSTSEAKDVDENSLKEPEVMKPESENLDVQESEVQMSEEQKADVQEPEAEMPEVNETPGSQKSDDCEASVSYQHIENKNDKEEGKEKPTIRNAVQKIRFLTLSAMEFADGPAQSPLLDKLEAYALIMNILCSSAAAVPIPPGFSTSRVLRKHVGSVTSSPSMPIFTVDTPSPVLVEAAQGSECSSHHSCVSMYAPPPRHDGGVVVGSECHSADSHGQCSSGGHRGRTCVERADRFEPVDLSHDVNRMYCQRTLVQYTDCFNSGVLDCSVTFMVDKTICLLGVEVPTQAPSEESSMPASSGYSELLYAHLLDADGARLTYTHYTNRVPYRHLLDIMFNRPVYIQKNKVYKVALVFNKVGWYPLGRCTHQVAAGSVFFNFCIGQSSDSVRDGLIRSIIFTY